MEGSSTTFILVGVIFLGFILIASMIILSLRERQSLLKD